MLYLIHICANGLVGSLSSWPRPDLIPPGGKRIQRHGWGGAVASKARSRVAAFCPFGRQYLAHFRRTEKQRVSCRAAQAALDRTPDATTAPRDHAARKVCDAFRAFESGAKAATKPLRIGSNRIPDVRPKC